MTVQGHTGGRGTRAVSKRYPATTGLTLATTSQKGRVANLIPKKKSLVRRDFTIGMD